jgi:hypothetical protein
MDERPGDAGGNEHGEGDKEEHQCPRRSGRGCPLISILLYRVHSLVYDAIFLWVHVDVTGRKFLAKRVKATATLIPVSGV